jgi:hypothetical protein
VASLSYEYDIKPNFTVGTGWGFMQISSGKYYTHNETRQGRYFDLVLSNQNYAMHRFFYQNKHRLITQYGITIQRRLEFVHFSDGGIQYADRPYLVPFLSAGYEFKGDNIIFRIPVYIAWIGISDWLFPVMPWLGVSVGIPLKKFNE